MTPTQNLLSDLEHVCVWAHRPDQTAQDAPLCIDEGMDVVVGGVHRPPLPIGYDRLSRGEVAVGSTDGEEKKSAT